MLEDLDEVRESVDGDGAGDRGLDVCLGNETLSGGFGADLYLVERQGNRLGRCDGRNEFCEGIFTRSRSDWLRTLGGGWVDLRVAVMDDETG